MTLRDLLEEAKETGLELPEGPPAAVAASDGYAAARWDLEVPETVHVRKHDDGRLEWHREPGPDSTEWRDPEPADGWELEELDL